jgi:hypothetical protein
MSKYKPTPFVDPEEPIVQRRTTTSNAGALSLSERELERQRAQFRDYEQLQAAVEASRNVEVPRGASNTGSTPFGASQRAQREQDITNMRLAVPERTEALPEYRGVFSA